jgi:hypothetical protein
MKNAVSQSTVNLNEEVEDSSGGIMVRLPSFAEELLLTGIPTTREYGLLLGARSSASRS